MDNTYSYDSVLHAKINIQTLFYCTSAPPSQIYHRSLWKDLGPETLVNFNTGFKGTFGR
uniref:Uncharacterized protein n=1 Tax=Anguilla anguilla TaxID=7936 RepID=A0A0E9SXV2_ANGAN